MKLKTEFQDEDFEKGEVADVSIATMPDGRIIVRAKAKRGGEHTFYYDSLEVLYNDWSDCEEPKEHYWVIDEDGVLICRTVGDFTNEGMCKQIGNYFETEEEAKKAVEKLRAWKRLRDKGFRFNDWHARLKNGVTIYARYDEGDEIVDDLNTLFGSEG